MKHRDLAISLGLFLGSLVLRIGTLFATADLVGWKPVDLAMPYDGHLYMVIARSLPAIYQDSHGIVPFLTTFRDPTYITSWFPLYPIAIRCVDLLIGDLRWSALLVSQVCSSLAVVAFHRLARRVLARPMPISIAFAFFPATWLVTGTFAFCEPVMMLCGILALLAYQRRDILAAAAWGGAAAVAQKHGALFLMAIFVTELWNSRDRGGGGRSAAILSLGAIPFAALQLYLWIAFGDLFANIRAHGKVFVGAPFGAPFVAFLEWSIRPDELFNLHKTMRKVLTISSVAFYVSLSWIAWRRRAGAVDVTTVLLLLTVAFVSTLTGPFAFYAQPRLCLVAAPAALLWLARVWPDSKRTSLWVAIACVLPLNLWIATREFESIVDLSVRVWTPYYFRMLPPTLNGGGTANELIRP